MKNLIEFINESRNIKQEHKNAVGEITPIDLVYFKYIVGGLSKKDENDKKSRDDFKCALTTKSPNRNCSCGLVFQQIMCNDKYVDGIPEPIGKEDGNVDLDELWTLIHNKNFKITIE